MEIWFNFAIAGNILKDVKKQVDLENRRNENHISDEFANSVSDNIIEQIKKSEKLKNCFKSKNNLEISQELKSLILCELLNWKDNKVGQFLHDFSRVSCHKYSPPIRVFLSHIIPTQ